MHNFNMIVVGAVTATLLAGCATRNSSDPTPKPLPDYTSFAEIAADADPLLAEYDGDPATDADDIPDSGTTTYDGFISIPLADGRLVGQLELEVAFAADDGTVATSADGFFHENRGAYTGDLSGVGTLTKIPGAGLTQIDASLGGMLSNGGTGYATSVALAGDIVSDGVDPIGAMAGTADAVVGASGLVFGEFAAER